MASPASFPSSDFDVWAETYDGDVEAERAFPFAGYGEALSTVVDFAAPKPGMTVLDLGTGTGNLAQRFAALGCELWCTDFSAAMLERASRKLPGSRMILHDLGEAWPPELERRFDRVISAYVFHHFTLSRKVQLIKDLALGHLTPGGRLVIADISFPDEPAMRAFAASVGELWEEEDYWLAKASMQAIRGVGLKVDYRQISESAGVYCIERSQDVRSAD
jgi:putative AdoMet-dependent methyltransferase